MWKLNQLAEAMNAAEKAIGFNPEYALAWGRKGTVLIEFGFIAEALDAIDKAIQLDSNLSHVHSNRGFVLKKLNRNEEALDAINKAIHLDSKSTNHSNRGNLLSELGRMEEALDALDIAIRLDPNDGFPWSEKAGTEFKQENYEIAKLSIVRAFHLKYSPIVDNLLAIHSKSSASPFLIFRAITTCLAPDKYSPFSKIIIDAFQQSVPLSLYLSYHELLQCWKTKHL
ncbi:MAG: tetratricopeptide repeat protein [Saprospiraceae bacterium]|nr:tetratricopeptide repeat protein [Saprospiraceae bacterium]